MVDILFISPDSSRETYQGLADGYSAIETPTWALLLAGSLRQYFEVAILDPQGERLTDHQAWVKVANYKPKLIVFVVYGQNPNSGSTNMAGAQRLARYIRLCDAATPIAFIGSHPSALPEETLKHEFVDYVLPGDGLQGLKDLAFSLPITKIKKQVIWSPVSDTKHFPEYPWDLVFPLSNYRAYNWFAGYDDSKRSPYAAVYTSLGCVFKCGFCMINLVNRSRFDQLDASHSTGMRYFPTEMILREFETLANLGVKNVRISDEMFFLNRQHYLPIIKGLIQRRLDLNLWAYARVDTIRSEYLGDFRDAGIRWLCLGIESANQTIRREIAKGSYENVNVRQVAKEIREAGINLLANFIIGLPEDSEESVEETVELALDLNAEHTNLYPCIPLPGSPIYRDQAVEAADEVPSYSRYSFHSQDCRPIATKHLSAADVLRLRDAAWERCTLDPAHLALIREKFGQVAVDHLVKQAQIPLRRNLLESARAA